MNSDMRAVITQGTYFDKELEILLLLDAHNHPIEIHVNDVMHPSLVGNMYIARVTQVMDQLHAAFLEAGPYTFYYHIEDIEHILFTHKNGNPHILCQGDELVVQVERDAIKTKEISVTTNLSFGTDSIVLTSGKPGFGISKKIPTERKKQLLELNDKINPLNDVSTKCGIVLRTAASQRKNEEILEDILALQEEYFSFKNKVVHKSCGSLVREAQHPFLDHINRFQRLGVTEFVTDNEFWLNLITTITSNEVECRKYSDDTYPLNKLYGISQMLEEAIEPNVYLSSGGYLLIEPTETLTVIDVNSGKNIKRKKREKYINDINKEAAREVVHQIRLRNISGMILVDFINMNCVEDQLALLSYMRTLVKDDFAKVNVLDITKLGLVEITRAKKSPSLKQSLS